MCDLENFGKNLTDNGYQIIEKDLPRGLPNGHQIISDLNFTPLCYNENEI